MKTLIIFLVFLLVAISCSNDEAGTSSENIYTLYRGGALIKSIRLHYATFETRSEKAEWNKENCEKIAKFLNEEQKHQTNPVIFWCEKGEFKE